MIKTRVAKPLDKNGNQAIDLTIEGPNNPESWGAPTLGVRTGNTHRTLVFENWNSSGLAEALLEDPTRVQLVSADDPLPYDRVQLEFTKDKRKWEVGTNSKSRVSFLRCQLRRETSLLVKLV